MRLKLIQNLSAQLTMFLKLWTYLNLKIFYRFFKVERTRLLTIPAICAKNPQLAGFLPTQNRSNFLYVEGFPAWLYDRAQWFHIFLRQINTVFQVYPITRRIFEYASPISGDTIPRKTSLHSLPCIGPKTYWKGLSLRIQTYIQKNGKRPNTFTFQEACTYTFKEPKRFWKRAFLMNTLVIHYNYSEKLLATNSCQNKK